MKRLPTFWKALLILAASSILANGQIARPSDASAISTASVPAATPRPQVTFVFERQGLPVPRYRLTIHDDGSAVYEGEEAFASSQNGSAIQTQPFRNLVRVLVPVSAMFFAFDAQVTLKCFSFRSVANTRPAVAGEMVTRFRNG